MPDLRTYEELQQEWIQRLRAHSPGVTWFGSLGIMKGVARATAALAYGAHRLYAALLGRYLLTEASGDALDTLAPSFGAERDEDGVFARVLAIPLPVTSEVSAITGALVEVPLGDGARWSVGWSVRLRNGDGTVTETRTIAAITSGTGPNGGDEIDLTTISGSYSPATEVVDLIARITVPARTVIGSEEGTAFETTAPITTGDANPLLIGSTKALSLATKVWAEAQVVGEIGNIEADTLTDSIPTIDGIEGWYNPESARGGAASETDGDLRVRAATGGAAYNQETLAWIQALAQQANPNVARAFLDPSLEVGTLKAKVIHRNGGAFSTTELAAIERYLDDRVRSYMVTSLSNVTLTSVEVEAVITLSAGYSLLEVYREAASRLADYLDWRSWTEGENVDEAALLSIVRTTPGVATLETSSFLPAADVVVSDDSVPTLVRLSLQDSTTGTTINATLAQSF